MGCGASTQSNPPIDKNANDAHNASGEEAMKSATVKEQAISSAGESIAPKPLPNVLHGYDPQVLSGDDVKGEL